MSVLRTLALLTVLSFTGLHSAWAELIPAERTINWSQAGLPSGIPKRVTIFRTINAATYGNGSTDATAAIQDALDNCPAGQVVYLPAGTYRTSDTVHLWTDTTLRGAGQGKTIIRYQGSGGRSVLDMRGMFYWNVVGLKRIFAVSAGGAKGSNQITLNATTGIHVGDVLLIDQLNDGTLVDNVGSEGEATYVSRDDGKRARGQIAEVTALAGNNVTLNLPMFFSLNLSLTPQAVLVDADAMVRRAGAEDLSLTQLQPLCGFIIEMDGAQQCWLKNVEVSGIDRRGVWHIESLQNEISECTFHDGLNGYGRDHGYGFQLDLQSTSNLVENNIFYAVDGGGVMTSGGAIGNVISYNYLPDIRFDDAWWMIGGPVPNHSAHPSMNLWEGNIGPQIAADFIHGSSSHQTIFRSRATGWKNATANSNNNAVDLQHKNTYMTVMGCVLGTAGQSTTYEVAYPAPASSSLKTIWRLGYGGPGGAGDTNVKATLLRHGNYDYVNNAVLWDSAIAERTLPASLYLSSRPSWWGSSPWPAIGPDVPGMVNKIPAQIRYENGGNRPPMLSSNATATPSSVVVNTVVAFAVGATDPDGDTLSYAWNFGDGASAAGATVTHSFSAPGTYTAIVTISDGRGGNNSSTVAVVVTPSDSGGGGGDGGGGGGGGGGDGGGGGSTIDTDGDGVSNVQEIADGTDPLDPNSFKLLPLTLSRLTGAVNFVVSGRDSCSVVGSVNVMPAGLSPKDLVAVLDIGGAKISFTLDAKGQGRNAKDRLKLKLPRTRNKAAQALFPGGDVAFSARVSQKDLRSSWRDEGLDPAADANRTALTFKVQILINGAIYGATLPVQYSARSGKGGRFKN